MPQKRFDSVLRHRMNLKNKHECRRIIRWFEILLPEEKEPKAIHHVNAKTSGFPDDFKIPVSDTQALCFSFSNSCVVPLMENGRTYSETS